MAVEVRCRACGIKNCRRTGDGTVICNTCGHRDSEADMRKRNSAGMGKRPRCAMCGLHNCRTNGDGTVVCRSCGHRASPKRRRRR